MYKGTGLSKRIEGFDEIVLDEPRDFFGHVFVVLRARIVGEGIFRREHADVDVGDVDGKDLEGGSGVESLCQHGLGDLVGVLEDTLVTFGGTDGRDDALADSGDDGLFGRTTDELRDVRSNRHASAGSKLDAVTGHGIDGRSAAVLARAIDHLGVDRGPHRFEYVSAGEIDRRRTVPRKIDLRLVRGDHRADHAFDVSAREVMRFELGSREV